MWVWVCGQAARGKQGLRVQSLPFPRPEMGCEGARHTLCTTLAPPKALQTRSPLLVTFPKLLLVLDGEVPPPRVLARGSQAGLDAQILEGQKLQWGWWSTCQQAKALGCIPQPLGKQDACVSFQSGLTVKMWELLSIHRNLFILRHPKY